MLCDCEFCESFTDLLLLFEPLLGLLLLGLVWFDWGGEEIGFMRADVCDGLLPICCCCWFIELGEEDDEEAIDDVLVDGCCWFMWFWLLRLLLLLLFAFDGCCCRAGDDDEDEEEVCMMLPFKLRSKEVGEETRGNMVALERWFKPPPVAEGDDGCCRLLGVRLGAGCCDKGDLFAWLLTLLIRLLVGLGVFARLRTLLFEFDSRMDCCCEGSPPVSSWPGLLSTGFKKWKIHI